MGWIKYRDNRIIDGTIKHATVSKDTSDHYFISYTIQQEIPNINYIEKVKITKQSKIIGLDMSLSNFFVDSNGNSPAYEKQYKKQEKRLNRLNHNLSRKVKGSNRYDKLRKSINFIHYHIANRRSYFTHKLSTKLVQENDVIVVESLNLKGMLKFNLGKSISDLGYSQFINQLKYKTEWQGKHLIFADKWFASSKICHNCGYKYKELTLPERKWTCPNCHSVIDRDLNAAINLKELGKQITHKCTLRQ